MQCKDGLCTIFCKNEKSLRKKMVCRIRNHCRGLRFYSTNYLTLNHSNATAHFRPQSRSSISRMQIWKHPYQLLLLTKYSQKTLLSSHVKCKDKCKTQRKSSVRFTTMWDSMARELQTYLASSWKEFEDCCTLEIHLETNTERARTALLQNNMTI